MGNAHHIKNKDNYDPELVANSSLPILFHATHSTSLQLSLTRRLVKRFDGCKGICFTSRPIDIGERIHIRIVESSNSWKGTLRFGYTCDDPTSINASDLPKFGCPDLTSEHGYWAKAVPESVVRHGNILFFYIKEDGSVVFGVNGEERGQLFTGVKTDILVWALMDVFGSTTAIELVDVLELSTMSGNAYGSSSSIEQSQYTSRSLGPHGALAGTSSYDDRRSASPSSLSHQQQQQQSFNHCIHARYSPNISTAITRDSNRTENAFERPIFPAATNPQSCKTVTEGRSSERRIIEVIEPMPFHTTIGRHISLSADRMMATRLAQDYCNGYVFTSRPLQLGEKLIISILKVDSDFVGGLAFGMTSCDPATVRLQELTDDSDQLLDRSEYWVVLKDVCPDPQLHDELSFHLTEKGEVRYFHNNREARTLMYVDCSLPLWAFIDVYGSSQQIRSLGVSRRVKTNTWLQSGSNKGRSPASDLRSGSLTSSFRSNHNSLSHQRPMLVSDNCRGSQSFQPSCNTTRSSSRFNSNNSQLLSSTVGEAGPVVHNSQPSQIFKTSRNCASFRTGMSRSYVAGDEARSNAPSGVHPQPENRRDNCLHESLYNFKLPSRNPIESVLSTSTTSNLITSDLLDDSLPTLPPPLIPIPISNSMLAAANLELTGPSLSRSIFRSTVVPRTNTGASAEVRSLSPSSVVEQPLNDTNYSFNHRNLSNPDSMASQRFPLVLSSNLLTRSSLELGTDAGASVCKRQVGIERLASEVNDPTLSGELSLDAMSIESASSECVVCLERAADSALYTCGHMCMCYTCAQEIMRKPNALCPICRQPISDVIKIFRS